MPCDLTAAIRRQAAALLAVASDVAEHVGRPDFDPDALDGARLLVRLADLAGAVEHVAERVAEGLSWPRTGSAIPGAQDGPARASSAVEATEGPAAGERRPCGCPWA